MIGALAKSMGLGTLTAVLGSVLYLTVFVVGLPKTIDEIRTCAFVIAVALIASLMMIITTTIVVGLPVAHLLQRARLENQAVYVLIGAAVGLIAPMFYGSLIHLPILISFWHVGCFSGAVTAFTWWMSYRRHLVSNC
jgi:hypothetical protein